MSAIRPKSPILVAGATGNVGRHVVSMLAQEGISVRAVSRHPDANGGSLLIEPVKGDLAAPSSLVPALEGVDTVFLMIRALSAPLEALLKLLGQRVNRIVFLSSAAIEDDRPVQTNPIAKFHFDAEEKIKQSVPQWTFLRPGAFAANALSWWAPQITHSDTLRWPYAEATSAPIHERDIAAVAVRALIEQGREGEKYFLTGGQSLTQNHQVELIGAAIGRDLRFEQITDDQARKQLTAVMPPFVIERLLQIWRASVGKPALATDTVKKVTGSDPTTYQQWATDHSTRFSRESNPGL
jgi:uncharacterized protein YbjT (DUF2867 family)